MSARAALNAIINDVRIHPNNVQPSSDHTTGLYTTIFSMDLLGGMFNSWVLATSFAKGLQLGGIWIGLPFFYGTLMWLAVIVTLLFIWLFVPREMRSLANSMNPSEGEQIIAK